MQYNTNNMAKFIIYTYQFSPINIKQLALFDDVSKESDAIMKKKQVFFERIFRSDFVFENNHKQYAHKMLFNKDHLIVFRLANDKKIKLEENFKTNKVVHSPSCLILIDNRNDVQKIAIEENKEAFVDTKTVANILQATFQKLLMTFNLSVEIQKEYQVSEFWDIAEKYRKGLTMVRFEFSYPNLPRVSKNINELISNTSKAMNSRRTVFELKSDDSEVLKLSRKNTQLNGLVEASAISGNAITIKAKGVRNFIKTGNTEKAFEVDDLESQLKDDLIYSVSSKLIELLNEVK